MSWWDALKSKLPEGVRQLPFQTSSYFSGQPAADPSVRTGPRTIELSSSIKGKKEKRSDEAEGDYDFDVEYAEEVHIEQSSKFTTTFTKEELEAAETVTEGWLAKQTVLSTVDNHTPWKNRYFILKRGCLFYYSVEAETTIQLENFKVEQDAKNLPVQLEGTTHIGYLVKLVFDVPIAGAVDTRSGITPTIARRTEVKPLPVAEGSDPLSAPVSVPVSTSPGTLLGTSPATNVPAASSDNNRLILAAESETERNEWLDVFHAISLGTASPDLEKRGWLLGFDSYARRWKPHYLTIKGTTLEYHNREKKGYFPLTASELWSSDGFSFSIRAGGKVLNVSASSQEERDMWMRAISKATATLEHKTHKGTRELLESSREIIDYHNQLRDCIEPEMKIIQERIKEMREQGIKAATQGADGKYRILSFDGGGMRGVINCIIFDRLLGMFPDLLSKVNFFVGTSNGGMLAMAFALGYSPDTARTLLEKSGKQVFKRRDASMTAGINNAKFSPVPLKIICDVMAEKITLGQVPKHVLVPAFLMDNFARDPTKRASEIRFYHNLPKVGDSYNSMMDELASDVVMRTIAAPTYFPSYQQHVDGGMFAHDPASSALTLVMSANYLDKRKEDIIMMSFGTGKVNHYYEDEEHDWGYVQWVPKLTNVLWDGMIMHSEHICKELLGDRYLRFNPLLEREISLDDPMEIPLLVETAKNLDLSPVIAFIRKHFYD